MTLAAAVCKLARGVPLLAALATASLAVPALAYTPGSGPLYSDDFEGTLDADWETGNAFTTVSPWTLVVDGTDQSFYADGYGQGPNAPTKHWARHYVHPASAASFSVAFEYRSELSSTYTFDLDVEQRAPVARKIRMHVSASGAVSLWRTENGVFVQVATTSANTVPANKKRWMRLAIEPDASGHRYLRFRIWSGGATSEPSTWTLSFLDDRDTIERAHRFELTADGPRGIETWIDDLDVFGTTGSGVLSPITTIYLWEGSHLDIGFTLPPDDIEAYAKTHLDQALANLDLDPRYRFTIEESWYLDRWWERSSEAERNHLLEHLRDGRLSLAAGYASLHTTTAGHEELIRNTRFSTRFAREHGGFRTRVWITDDVPGTSFAVPEILARSGIDYFVGGMNTPFGGRTNRPSHGDRPMWWVGPDGSRVLSWFTFDSYAEGFDYGFSWFDGLSDLWTKLGKKLPEQEEAGYRYPELLMMRAFDNNYAGFKARDLVDQWNATYDTPRFVLATAEEFLDTMLARYGEASFPSFSGDWGCAWSASHDQAQHTEERVRDAHRTGRQAEAMLAVGSALDGGPVPVADVDFLYRRELEVDEHSGAGGWPGYWNAEQLDRNNRIHLGYAEDAQATAHALLDEGLARVASQLSSPGSSIAAMNPLGRARDGWVRATLPAELYGTSFRVIDRGTGAELPYQRFDATSEILFRASGVPGVGYRVYDLAPGSPSAVPAGTLTASGTTIENDFYRLQVSATDGSVTSLVDKTTGRELVDTASSYRFNRLASNVNDDVTAASPPVPGGVSSASVSVGTAGPMVASLVATRTGTPLVQSTYRLYRGENRVEIENVLDKTLMAYVPYSTSSRSYTVTLPFDVHDFEIRTESTTRFVNPPADRFDPTNQVWDWHNVEHTLAFWDSNVGILYAVDAVDAHNFEHLSAWPSNAYTNGNGLVLSRLFTRTDEYKFSDGTTGPYAIEPGTSTTFRYTHHFRATPPSFDPETASRFGFEALEPLRPVVVTHRPGDLPASQASFFSIEDAPSVLLYTVKGADDGDGTILRMTELGGTPVTARVSSTAFTLASPERVGHDEGEGTPLATSGGAVLVPMGAYETATVRVRAAPGWAPIALRADKSGGSVRLTWSGGNSPFTALRADDAAFSSGGTPLLDEDPATTVDDASLADGVNRFYLVK